MCLPLTNFTNFNFFTFSGNKRATALARVTRKRNKARNLYEQRNDEFQIA